MIMPSVLRLVLSELWARLCSLRRLLGKNIRRKMRGSSGTGSIRTRRRAEALTGMKFTNSLRRSIHNIHGNLGGIIGSSP